MGIVALFALVGLMVITGCDATYEKNAGRGGERMQPYNPDNGQYMGYLLIAPCYIKIVRGN